MRRDKLLIWIVVSIFIFTALALNLISEEKVAAYTRELEANRPPTISIDNPAPEVKVGDSLSIEITISSNGESDLPNNAIRFTLESINAMIALGLNYLLVSSHQPDVLCNRQVWKISTDSGKGRILKAGTYTIEVNAVDLGGRCLKREEAPRIVITAKEAEPEVITPDTEKRELHFAPKVIEKADDSYVSEAAADTTVSLSGQVGSGTEEAAEKSKEERR